MKSKSANHSTIFIDYSYLTHFESNSVAPSFILPYAALRDDCFTVLVGLNRYMPLGTTSTQIRLGPVVGLMDVQAQGYAPIRKYILGVGVNVLMK